MKIFYDSEWKIHSIWVKSPSNSSDSVVALLSGSKNFTPRILESTTGFYLNLLPAHRLQFLSGSGQVEQYFQLSNFYIILKTKVNATFSAYFCLILIRFSLSFSFPETMHVHWRFYHTARSRYIVLFPKILSSISGFSWRTSPILREFHRETHCGAHVRSFSLSWDKSERGGGPVGGWRVSILRQCR